MPKTYLNPKLVINSLVVIDRPPSLLLPLTAPHPLHDSVSHKDAVAGVGMRRRHTKRAAGAGR